jgi:hypothetical protein
MVTVGGRGGDFNAVIKTAKTVTLGVGSGDILRGPSDAPSLAAKHMPTGNGVECLHFDAVSVPLPIDDKYPDTTEVTN